VKRITPQGKGMTQHLLGERTVAYNFPDCGFWYGRDSWGDYTRIS